MGNGGARHAQPLATGNAERRRVLPLAGGRGGGARGRTRAPGEECAPQLAYEETQTANRGAGGGREVEVDGGTAMGWAMGAAGPRPTSNFRTSHDRATQRRS